MTCDRMGCDSVVSDDVLCGVYSVVEDGVWYFSMLLYVHTVVHTYTYVHGEQQSLSTHNYLVHLSPVSPRTAPFSCHG